MAKQKNVRFYVSLWAIAVAVFATAGCAAADTSPALQTPAATVVQAATDSLSSPEIEASGGDFDVQGHRGARGLKPENTLPAFETALDLGVTTLELDLHLTADDVVVVWHDARIDKSKCRLSSGADGGIPDPDDGSVAQESLMVRALTFEQLQGYQCDRNPDTRRFLQQDSEATTLAGDDFGVISLVELFEFVESYGRSELKTEAQRENAARVRFNLETKRKPDEPETIGDGFDGQNPGLFESEILEQIGNYGLMERSVIQSFDHRSLWAVRSAVGEIELAALTTRGRAEPVDFANEGADIWSPDYRVLTAALVEDAHEAGLRVIPWTVNEPSVMEALIGMGVDGMISDRPELLLEMVGEQS